MWDLAIFLSVYIIGKLFWAGEVLFTFIMPAVVTVAQNQKQPRSPSILLGVEKKMLKSWHMEVETGRSL